MMKKRMIVLASLVLATAIEAPAGGTVSDPVSINTSYRENRYWERLSTNEVDIAWRWLTNATSAQLMITGMDGSVLVTNVAPSMSNILWRAFEPCRPSAENVYELTLVFHGANDVIVGAQTSHVAVVKGAFGTVAIDPNPVSKTWNLVKGNVIIPYEGQWSNLTAGASTGQLVIENAGTGTQTNSLDGCAGYWGWRVSGTGTFALALNLANVSSIWTAQLFRFNPGTILLVR